MKQSNFIAVFLGLTVSLLAISLLVVPSNAAPRLQTATATPAISATASPAIGATASPAIGATATVTGTVSATPTVRTPSTLPTTGDGDSSGTLLLFSILGIALLAVAFFVRSSMRNNVKH